MEAWERCTLRFLHRHLALFAAKSKPEPASIIFQVKRLLQFFTCAGFFAASQLAQQAVAGGHKNGSAFGLLLLKGRANVNHAVLLIKLLCVRI
jgi:hypothetical protein